MSVRTLMVVALIGFTLAWCAGASAGEKPKTGFVHKTFTDAAGKKIPYVVYVPKAYDGKKVYPVILYLHGLGEKNPIPWGLGTYVKAGKDLDFLCVFPHTDRPTWDPGRPGEKIALRALDAVLADYKADRNRVYLTGFSMGGTGTWSLGAKYADRWAALVPVASESTPEWAAKVKDIPIWAFEGSLDKEGNVQKGREAVEFVRKAGGHAILLERPKVGHQPDHAYHHEPLYAWLKKQHRNPADGDRPLKQPSAGDWTLRSEPGVSGTWATIRAGHRLIYLGGDRVLDWEPDSGHYRIWAYDRTRTGQQDPFAGDPVAEGTWETIRTGHQLVYLGEDRVLDWEPDSGHYRIWAYGRGATGAGDPFPGEPLVEGTWRSVGARHRLVYLGDDHVLDWQPSSGHYRIRLYHRPRTGQSDPLSDPPVAEGTWETIKTGHHLISLEGKRVLDWEPATGHYRIWRCSPRQEGREDPFPGEPVVEGTWETIRSGHQLFYLGGNCVLDWEPATGNYRIWTYDCH